MGLKDGCIFDVKISNPGPGTYNDHDPGLIKFKTTSRYSFSSRIVKKDLNKEYPGPGS